MFPELRIQGFGNVMLEWARHVEDSGWLNNRLHSTQFNGETDTIYPDQKTHGTIVETMKNKQYNLYMHRLSETITIEAFLPRLEDHPLLAIGSIPPKRNELGLGHLSAVNYCFRTKTNYSVLLGYSAHGDPKPQFPVPSSHGDPRPARGTNAGRQNKGRRPLATGKGG